MSDIVIKDCPEQTIKCPDCSRPLVHYKVIAPEADVKTKLFANCPFCGSEAFPVEVKGMFWWGPIGQEETEFLPTVVENANYDEDNGILTFEVKKR